MCQVCKYTLRHWGRNRQQLSFIKCLMEIIRERLRTFLGAWTCLIHCIIHGLSTWSNLKLILKCCDYFTNFKIEINLILCWICCVWSPTTCISNNFMVVTECKRRMGHFLKATQRSRGSWRTDVCIPCRRAGRISRHPRSTRLGSSHPQISGLTPKRSADTLVNNVYMLRVVLKCYYLVQPHSIDKLCY